MPQMINCQDEVGHPQRIRGLKISLTANLNTAGIVLKNISHFMFCFPHNSGRPAIYMLSAEAGQPDTTSPQCIFSNSPVCIHMSFLLVLDLEASSSPLDVQCQGLAFHEEINLHLTPWYKRSHFTPRVPGTKHVPGDLNRTSFQERARLEADTAALPCDLHPSKKSWEWNEHVRTKYTVHTLSLTF